ncbi:MAG: glycerol acyltransferase [Deltaproteobacteria bacterium]|nr:glycerol acyltransferase [Deltaproteobacteria bacterium]
MAVEGGVSRALGDLVSGLLPLSMRELQSQIEDRLAKLPNRFNEFGYDPYGLSPEWLQHSVLPVVLLYRYWFRCRVYDIDRLPAGRVLLVANHAGQLPFDAAMLATAMLLEADPPRIARGMGEYFIPRLPFFSVLASRGGAMVGTPTNCAHMLDSDECVMVFPEGVRGISKTWPHRYELQRFGLGFMRLALQTNTPIVPVGIVGSEEQAPGLANLDGLARRFGLPALPVTLTFPWLGPLGVIPLPARYHIVFGEPLHFTGDANDEDTGIEEKVERVKAAVEALLERGLDGRDGVFR